MLLARDPAFAGVVQAAKARGVQAVTDVSDEDAAELVTAMGPESIERLDELTDRVIVSRVAGWSYEQPVSADALLELPGGAYDRLKELTAAGALAPGPDFAPSMDPASPTAPSTA
jgi:hypothetical protein